MKIEDIKIEENIIKDYLNNLELSENREEIANKMFIPMLKKQMDIISLKSTQNLYYIIMDYPITRAYCMLNSQFDDVSTLENYQKNLRKVIEAGNDLLGGINKYHQMFPNEDISNYEKTRNYFVFFVQEILNYVNVAILISQNSENKSDNEYLKMLTKKLPDMNRSLKMASNWIECLERYGKDYIDVFEGVVDFASKCSELILNVAKQVLEDEKQQRETEFKLASKIDESRIVKYEPNPKEQARLQAIKLANDKYQEFCLDVMRDLEKQYALSSKDMYEYFVNVKFKKFVDKYPMPIPNSASEGYANEVIGQINNLMDYVSKISENSYVTSAFDK